VRYIGCSDFAPWQLCAALWTAKTYNLESFIVASAKYNMINRRIEQELVPCCQTYGVGVVPLAVLAGGFLTGKYRRGKEMPKGTRFGSVPTLYRRKTPGYSAL